MTETPILSAGRGKVPPQFALGNTTAIIICNIVGSFSDSTFSDPQFASGNVTAIIIGNIVGSFSDSKFSKRDHERRAWQALCKG